MHGGFYGAGGVGGGQAEAIRVPQAAGTLVTAPASADSDPALLNSLLAITDVYLTGYHAAYMGRVEAGKTVTVVGDGAVGLSAVLASSQLGAENASELERAAHLRGLHQPHDPPGARRDRSEQNSAPHAGVQPASPEAADESSSARSHYSPDQSAWPCNWRP